jgi:twitching motility protein PilT
LVERIPDMISIEDLLKYMVDHGGSDLHISANTRPKIRIDGRLNDSEFEPLDGEDCRKLIYSLLSTDQIARFEKNLELDLSFGVKGLGRFRTNVFHQRGTVAGAFRMIPYEVRGFQELGLPETVCKQMLNRHKGLILVTGATGSGKSTTLAAMVKYLNENLRGHIITVEDPIEFLHKNELSLFTQREVGTDTWGFSNALRSILRQDPDVVLIGEMRDVETIEAALTLSETGHLTLATLHTNDAIQTINRIIDVFPQFKQQQIRTQLSFTLLGVFCQQLLPRAHGSGRVLGSEVMIANSAIRSLIREGKIHQIASLVQTGRKFGMRTMNQSLIELYKEGAIDLDTALGHSQDPEDLRRNLQIRSPRGLSRVADFSPGGN